MLPASVESGALLLSKVIVPPLWVDGFTVPVTAALNATVVVLPPPLLLLLPPLLHAAAARVMTAPTAASIPVLRLIK